jgi:hypothetical protein
VSQFGLINWNDHGEEADSNTSNQTANVQHFDNDSGRLNDATYDENTASHQNRSATAKRVRERGQEGSAEAARGEQGHDRSRAGIAILLKKEMYERVGGDNFCYDTAEKC